MRMWLPITGVLAAIAMMARKGHASVPSLNINWSGWQWPVPIWNGREPLITDGFFPTATSSHRQHEGADIGYRKLATDPAGLPWSTPGFTSQKPPPPILSVFGGKVFRVRSGSRGMNVLIDHGNVQGTGIVTWYQHLSSVNVREGDVVSAGSRLGIMGGDLAPNYTWIHLHFELWAPVKGTPERSWKRDPAPYMKLWKKVSAT